MQTSSRPTSPQMRLNRLFRQSSSRTTSSGTVSAWFWKSVLLTSPATFVWCFCVSSTSTAP